MNGKYYVASIYKPNGQLLDKYFANAKKVTNYVRSNKEHRNFQFIKRIQQFLEPYKSWPISDFGPDELLDVQDAVVKYEYVSGKKRKRYTRRGVNDTIKWIRRIWRWGMGRQLVKPELVQGLEEFKPLKMGYANTYDNHKRERVTEKELWKVVEAVNSVVGDMLKLIWYTGMWPHEVCDMRPYDIICDNPECWLYILGRDRTPVGKHKTTRYEHVKVIPLTAEAQKILAPRIKDFNSKKYVFSPKEAIREFRENKFANRKT